MTSFHIIFMFIYFLSTLLLVSEVAKKCVVDTTLLRFTSLCAVLISGFLFRYWSIAAMSVAFIPLLTSVFLKFWKIKRIQDREEQIFLVFVEKIILKMQNGKSFRACLAEIHRESDAFVQQNEQILTYLVSFSTQQPTNLTKKQETYLSELMLIDKKPHLALVHLKLLQRSLRLQIFFRRKSGQVSFQARFQSFFVVGIYFVILFLQIRFLGFAAVKTYFALSLPLLLIGFYFTQRIGKKLKWKL